PRHGERTAQGQRYATSSPPRVPDAAAHGSPFAIRSTEGRPLRLSIGPWPREGRSAGPAMNSRQPGDAEIDRIEGALGGDEEGLAVDATEGGVRRFVTDGDRVELGAAGLEDADPLVRADVE